LGERGNDKPEMTERVVGKLAEPLKKPVENLAGVAVLVLGVVFISWGVMKIWGLTRYKRMGIANAELKTRLTAQPQFEPTPAVPPAKKTKLRQIIRMGKRK